MNRDGETFADVSAVAGLDSVADGRCFVAWDYDRDGWQDIAVVNANHPQLELFHNEIGLLEGQRQGGGEVLALRFVGGNASAGPGGGWSARDGYGARVEVDLGDVVLRREHRAGEGLGAQNSATLVIGIGRRSGARSLRIRWPSGRSQEIAGVAAGTLLTVHEDPGSSPTGEAFLREPYRLAPVVSRSIPTAAKPTISRLALPLPEAAAALHVYSTMATWCEPCRAEVPHLERLRAAFSTEEVAMYAVPVDAADGPEKLTAWMRELAPPYRMLDQLTPAERAEVERVVSAELRSEGIPATLVTDREHRVLHVQWGPPTVSTLRALLAEIRG